MQALKFWNSIVHSVSENISAQNFKVKCESYINTFVIYVFF